MKRVTFFPNQISPRCPAAWAGSSPSRVEPTPRDRADAKLCHRDWQRAAAQSGVAPGPDWRDLDAAARWTWVLMAMQLRYRQHIRRVRAYQRAREAEVHELRGGTPPITEIRLRSLPPIEVEDIGYIEDLDREADLALEAAGVLADAAAEAAIEAAAEAERASAAARPGPSGTRQGATVIVRVATVGPTLVVYAPYDAGYVSGAKALGGRWDPDGRAWSLPLHQRDQLRALLVRVYRTDGGLPAPAAGPRTPRTPREVVAQALAELQTIEQTIFTAT